MKNFRFPSFYWACVLIGLTTVPALGAFQSRMGELLLSAGQAHIVTDANQGRTIILTGSVQVIYRGQHVTADEIRINQQTKEIDAIGNVVFLTPTVKMQGDRVTLNTETNTGQVYHAYLEAGRVQLSGSLIQKTGIDTFTATDGEYTACSTCPPGWSFSGAKIEAQLGAYTYIKNPILRLGGVPVLWLPYLVVPLKSERQSGLLYPSFETSHDSGFAISDSAFWAIDPSHDATFGVKNYSNRGVKALGQYRYVLNPTDRGTLDTAYMRDAQPAAFNSGNSLERFFIKYDHLYNLPNDYIQRMNLYYVNDIRYPRDFSTEVGGYGEPALENRASLTKNTESSSSTVEADYYINMLHSSYQTDNRDAIHRAPEIITTQVPQPVGLGDLQFSNEASYTYFQRNSTSFTYNPSDPAVSPVFNPDVDPYRTGQRLMVNPSLEYPIALGVIDLQPSLGFNESHYYFQNTSPLSTANQAGSATSNQPEAQRRYVRSEISARTRLSHIYGDSNREDALRYKHEIVPELSYSAIPWLQSTSHPFFGGTQDVLPYAARDIPISDRDLLQFDYRDRLIQRDVLTAALTNRITRRQWINNKPDYRQIASLRLAQSYDFYENYRTSVTSRQPYSDISALLDVRLENLEIASYTQFYPYQNVAKTASRARVFNEQGNFFQFEYDKQYQLQAPDPNSKIQSYQLDTSSANENLSAGAGFLTTYATLLTSVQYSISSGQLSSYMVGTDLRPPGNCWLLSLRYTKNFQADENLGFAFNLLFDGNTATPINKL